MTFEEELSRLDKRYELLWTLLARYREEVSTLKKKYNKTATPRKERKRDQKT